MAPSGRIASIAVVVAVAFLGFAIALHPVVSEDLFWHLAAGRWIVEHRELPRTDPFTFTLTDRPWTNLQWLGDVIAARTWGWAGANGIVLAKALAFALLGAILVGVGRATGAGVAASGAAATLAVLACAERTYERPEVATYVLLAATLAVGLSARSGSGRSALRFFPAVVVIHVLWANLHALAFLGPATLLLLAAMERSRLLAAGAAAGALALLVNPFGPAAWTFPRTLLRRISGEEQAFAGILEFASPLDAPGDRALRAFWLIAALSAIVLIVNTLTKEPRATRTRRVLSSAVLILPYLALALLARRNIPLFAIAAAPVLARELHVLMGARSLPARAVWPWVPAAAALALGIAVLRGASPALFGLWRDRGLGVEPGLFPETCLEALDLSGAQAPLFNDIDYGGYISWRDPERKTFVDGRLEVLGPERLATYVAAHRSSGEWSRLRSSYGFGALLLEHSSPGSAAFLRARLEDGEWRLARIEPEAALLLRSEGTPAGAADVRPMHDDWMRILGQTRGPEPHAGRALATLGGFIDRGARRIQGEPRNAPVRAACRLANACLTLGWIEEAETGYDQVLELAPRDPEALFNRAICDLRGGDIAAARTAWRRALPLVDSVTRRRIEEAIAALPE